MATDAMWPGSSASAWRQRVGLLLTLGLGVVGLASGEVRAESKQPTYDVSYVWSPRRAAVFRYRTAVLRTLGPRMEARLQVVRAGRLYGLIYDRDGDAASALRVARAHTRLLTAAGLEPAAPVRSDDWPVLAAAGPPEPRRSEVRRAPASAVDLGGEIDAFIKGLRRRGRIADDERTAWSVYDLTADEKLVSINEAQSFQAASMIKPFVALALLHEVESGRLTYGAESRRRLERMIQRSDNPATNWVMSRLGGPRAVDRLLRRQFGGIFRETRIVEYIPAGGRTYRNRASARDYSRFLYALWHDRLPEAAELKRLMALPNRDRVNTGVSAVPAGTRVYDKTGSTRHLCGTMGILEIEGPDGQRHAYTLIGIIQKRRPAADYFTWIRSRGDVIRQVSTLVYRSMTQRSGLAPQVATVPRLTRPDASTGDGT